MIHFFRDVLDGPLYIVIVVFAVVFIMAIIGFMMERKKFEREAKAKVAVITTVTPSVDPTTGVVQEAPVQSSNAATAEVSNFIDFGSTESSPSNATPSNVGQVPVAPAPAAVPTAPASSQPAPTTAPVNELVLNSQENVK